jgi:arylsulfatase A-like enzyme/tetratricopeptide (TPR) repeat protein
METVDVISEGSMLRLFPVRRLFGLMIAALLLFSCACGRASRQFRNAPVVLISIDTLRADHLPAYGYKDVKTPAIDAFRRDSVLFGNAYSHVPLTLPSHTTMMTGLLPPQAAVRDNIGYVLSSEHPTVATVLKKQGYATAAAVSAVVLASSSGINQGFDSYEDSIQPPNETATLSQVQRSGFETEKIAEKWISAHEGAPFFFFLHLYEPHTPYTPIAPFDKLYADRPYDGEIATVDQVVGQFVEFLRKEGIYDKALILLVSDHGEGLGEHGEAEHGILIYRETLHVPMMIKLPGQRQAGASVEKPVGLEDLFPTIAQVVSVAPPPNLPGRTLPFDSKEAAAFPVRDIYSETLYPRYHLGWSDLVGLTNDQFEYIHAPKEELYDFSSDPVELRNLAGDLPPAFRRMRNLLLGMDRPRQAPGKSDPEQVKKLTALGYLGTTSAPDDAENLPNPVEHMAELKQLHEAIRLYTLRHYDQSIPVLRDLLKKAPGMTDAWVQLSNTFHKMGRTEESIAALKKAEEWKPGDPITLASIANEYFDLGDTAQAKRYSELSIAVNGPAEAHEVLASVMLKNNDLAGAEREARLALQNGHMGHIKPEMLLAQIRKAHGDLTGALAQLTKVEEELKKREDRQVSGLHSSKGDIFARLGRNAEAEREFRLEIDDFPGNPAGWTSLTFLLASEGRSAEARQTLLKMASQSPTPRCLRAASETFRILGDAAAAAYWRRQTETAVRSGSRPPSPAS